MRKSVNHGPWLVCGFWLLTLAATSTTSVDATQPNYMTMTAAQLALVPQAELQAEMNRLTAVYQKDVANLKTLQSENSALCNLYVAQLNSCPGMQSVDPAYFSDDLNCASANKAYPTNPTMEVTISGETIPNTYVVDLDGLYRSNEFTSPSATINFTPVGGGQPTSKPPRFMDISSMMLRAIEPGTGSYTVPIAAAAITPAANLKIAITINAVPLMTDFTLVSPSTGTGNSSSLLINPQGVANLGTQSDRPACVVTASQIKSIQIPVSE